ncbi:MAG: 50S ribosomal protein L17 [Patescibacteria group bacterium]|nr:50S ribosomal protein L17 [Patescibacteria group bacterium]
MRHRRKGKTLDRKNGPRKALLRNLATSVILYEHINTTLAKAKAVKPIVEKLVTTGKQKTLVSRRKLASYLTIESAVNKVLEETGPRYATRNGGYMRIIKLGVRQGDGAEMAQLQFVND